MVVLEITGNRDSSVIMIEMRIEMMLTMAEDLLIVWVRIAEELNMVALDDKEMTGNMANAMMMAEVEIPLKIKE